MKWICRAQIVYVSKQMLNNDDLIYDTKQVLKIKIIESNIEITYICEQGLGYFITCIF